MIRTQIRLEPDEYLLAKKEAKALGISMAEFVPQGYSPDACTPL